MKVTHDRRWAGWLSLPVPIAFMLALVALPPSITSGIAGHARTITWILVALGAVGIAFLPIRTSWKLLAMAVYCPAMFMLLAIVGVGASCLIHGASACI